MKEKKMLPLYDSYLYPHDLRQSNESGAKEINLWTQFAKFHLVNFNYLTVWNNLYCNVSFSKTFYEKESFGSIDEQQAYWSSPGSYDVR